MTHIGNAFFARWLRQSAGHSPQEPEPAGGTGGQAVPTSLLNEMDREREAIARIEAELEQMRGET